MVDVGDETTYLVNNFQPATAEWLNTVGQSKSALCRSATGDLCKKTCPGPGAACGIPGLSWVIQMLVTVIPCHPDHYWRFCWGMSHNIRALTDTSIIGRNSTKHKRQKDVPWVLGKQYKEPHLLSTKITQGAMRRNFHDSLVGGFNSREISTSQCGSPEWAKNICQTTGQYSVYIYICNPTISNVSHDVPTFVLPHPYHMLRTHV